MKDSKLTVLDFKKEQLVNLNEEDMTAVKGGVDDTTYQCIRWAITFMTAAVAEGEKASLWSCPEPEFKVTDNYLGDDITCASSPDVIING